MNNDTFIDWFTAGMLLIITLAFIATAYLWVIIHLISLTTFAILSLCVLALFFYTTKESLVALYKSFSNKRKK